MIREVKVVVVGDGAADKTVALISYTEGKYPKEYIPTVFDNYEATIVVDGEEIKFALWDTVAAEGYSRIRTLSYPKTDVFLIFFSVVNHHSFCNVEERWYPEIKYHCSHTPIILVGNNTHLRNDPSILQSLAKENQEPVTAKEAESMAKRIGAITYVECSALTRKGLKNVFDTALLVGLGTFQKFTISPPKLQNPIALTAEIVKVRDVFDQDFKTRQKGLLDELSDLTIKPLPYPIFILYKQIYTAKQSLVEAKNSNHLAMPPHFDIFNLKLPHYYVDWFHYHRSRLKQHLPKNLQTSFLQHSALSKLIKTIKLLKKSMKHIKSFAGSIEQPIKVAFQQLLQSYNQYGELLLCQTLSETELECLISPPALLLGLTQGEGILNKMVSTALFKQKDNKASRGTATVKAYGGLHFKLRPRAPGVEFLVGTLGSLLFHEGTTPTELIKFYDNEGTPYCCQVSKTVVGEMLEDIIIEQPEALKLITSANFTDMFLLGLLTNPQDWKADNFMVKVKRNKRNSIVQLRIIGIDNDIAFADPWVEGRNSSNMRIINIHNVLYFFPQMNVPLDNIVKNTFLKKLPEIVLLDWIKLIYQKNSDYIKLLKDGIFSEAEFTGDNKSSGLGLQLPVKFQPGTLKKLYSKLTKIQCIITHYENITHNELLKLIQPEVYYYYADIISEISEHSTEALKDKRAKNSLILAYQIASYEKGIEDPKEQQAFKTRISQGDNSVMTESVIKTAAYHGFEKNRAQPLLNELLEIFSVIAYEQTSTEFTETLFNIIEDTCQTVVQKSAVQTAVIYDVLPLLNWLINCQLVDINEKDKQGCTLLHYTANKGNAEMTFLLLKNGADINITNHRGKTPLQSAHLRLKHALQDIFLSSDEMTTIKTRYQEVFELFTVSFEKRIFSHSVKKNSKNQQNDLLDSSKALNAYHGTLLQKTRYNHSDKVLTSLIEQPNSHYSTKTHP